MGTRCETSCVSNLLIHPKCLEVDQACQVLKTLIADVSSGDVEFLEGGKRGEVGKVFDVDLSVVNVQGVKNSTLTHVLKKCSNVRSTH